VGRHGDSNSPPYRHRTRNHQVGHRQGRNLDAAAGVGADSIEEAKGDMCPLLCHDLHAPQLAEVITNPHGPAA
jgi:hypothetical protein